MSAVDPTPADALSCPPVAAPTAIDLLAPLLAQLTPLATQAAADAAHGATSQQAQLLAVAQQDIVALQALGDAHSTQIAGALARVGDAVLTRVEEDPLTQRLVVLVTLGAVLLAGLAILIAALLGNVTANRWIAGAPIALVGAVIWVSKAGLTLSRPVRA